MFRKILATVALVPSAANARSGNRFHCRSLFGPGIAQRHQIPVGRQHGVSMTEMLDAGAGG